MENDTRYWHIPDDMRGTRDIVEYYLPFLAKVIFSLLLFPIFNIYNTK